MTVYIIGNKRTFADFMIYVCIFYLFIWKLYCLLKCFCNGSDNLNSSTLIQNNFSILAFDFYNKHNLIHMSNAALATATEKLNRKGFLDLEIDPLLSRVRDSRCSGLYWR
jgi:hypothetical protein